MTGASCPRNKVDNAREGCREQSHTPVYIRFRVRPAHLYIYGLRFVQPSWMYIWFRVCPTPVYMFLIYICSLCRRVINGIVWYFFLSYFRNLEKIRKKKKDLHTRHRMLTPARRPRMHEPLTFFFSQNSVLQVYLLYRGTTELTLVFFFLVC